MSVTRQVEEHEGVVSYTDMHVHFVSCSVDVKSVQFFDCNINISTPIVTHIFLGKRPINLNSLVETQRTLYALTHLLPLSLPLLVELISSNPLTAKQSFSFSLSVKLLNRVPELTSL